MHPDGRKLELLEQLAMDTGCSYLSDLHQPERQLGIRILAPHISTQAYTLQEWEDAVEYITGVRRRFHSVSQAQEFLSCYRSEQ